jgi:hypothetical protein
MIDEEAQALIRKKEQEGSEKAQRHVDRMLQSIAFEMRRKLFTDLVLQSQGRERSQSRAQRSVTLIYWCCSSSGAYTGP